MGATPAPLKKIPDPRRYAYLFDTAKPWISREDVLKQFRDALLSERRARAVMGL